MVLIKQTYSTQDKQKKFRKKLCLLLLLAYAIKIQSDKSSSISRVKLGQIIIQLSKRAGFDDVVHRLV